LGNRRRDLLRAELAGAGVDQDDALRGDDEAEIGVRAVVVLAALTERADDGVDVVDNFFRFRDELGGLGRSKDKTARTSSRAKLT
jgi:hypothetical protein